MLLKDGAQRCLCQSLPTLRPFISVLSQLQDSCLNGWCLNDLRLLLSDHCEVSQIHQGPFKKHRFLCRNVECRISQVENREKPLFRRWNPAGGEDRQPIQGDRFAFPQEGHHFSHLSKRQTSSMSSNLLHGKLFDFPAIVQSKCAFDHLQLVRCNITCFKFLLDSFRFLVRCLHFELGLCFLADLDLQLIGLDKHEVDLGHRSKSLERLPRVSRF